MKFRKFAAAVAVVIGAPALVACGSGDAGDSDGAGVVRFGSYQPSSLDPRKSGALDAVFLTPVYDSLIRRTPSGEILPALATEWEFSEDGLTFDLTLREGVTFHDGEPFDAEAVEANILAGKEPGAAKAGELSAVESVEVVSEHEVRLHLSRPASQLVGVLAGEAGMMISPAALDDPDLATDPVGAGPYQVTKFTQGEIEYTAWDGYWDRDRVMNSKLIFVVNTDVNTQFRALQSGQLNLYSIPFAMVEAAREAGLNIESARSSNIWQVVLNTTIPELSSPEVRKAISLAIDRTGLSEAVFGGFCTPTAQPFNEGFVGYAEDLEELATKRDLDEARRLMAEAGYPDGFDVKLQSSTSTQQQNSATVLQAQLKEIGIEVEIDVMDQAQSTARQREGQFEMVMSVPTTGRPDPTAYVASFYAEGGVMNPGFSLDVVDEKLLEVEASSDSEERSKGLAEITTAVYEAGAPTVPLCSSRLDFGFPDNVSGVHPPQFNDWDWTSIVVE